MRHRSSRRGPVHGSRFRGRGPPGDPGMAPWPHPSVTARPPPGAPLGAHVPRGATSAPGDHTLSDHPGTRRRLREHPAASPPGMTVTLHRPARHILPAPPMPRDVFQRSARVVRASSVESCDARFEILPDARRWARARDYGRRLPVRCAWRARTAIDRRVTGEFDRAERSSTVVFDRGLDPITLHSKAHSSFFALASH